MPIIIRLFIILVCAAAFTSASPAHAQGAVTPIPPSKSSPADRPVASGGALTPADPSTELLRSADVTLTRGDYDAQVERLPADSRAEFGTNIDRVNTLLRIILVDKTLAKQARTAGLDHDPDIQRRIASETDRILSQAVVERDLKQWNAEFDARPNMVTAARERWLAQPAKYRAPEDVQLTQILYATSKDSRAEARAKALDARNRIVAGADMGGIARSESNDAATAQTGGKVDWTPMDHLDSRMSRAISTSLHKPGDLSQPIVTEAGVYLVRLDAQRPGVQKPFDEVKASIMQDLRKEYVDTMRAKKMAAIRDDPSIVVNQPAVDALVVRIDPDFARKAVEGGHKRDRGEPKEPPSAK